MLNLLGVDMDTLSEKEVVKYIELLQDAIIWKKVAENTEKRNKEVENYYKRKEGIK